MKHADTGTLRAYLDGQLDPAKRAAIEHLKSCVVCEGELKTLRDHAARVRDGLDRLPELSSADNPAMAWAAFQNKREDWMENHQSRWSLGRRLSLAGAALGAVAVALVLTVAPVRAWAESLLGIFRVERFTVLEIDPSALKGNASTKQPTPQPDDQPRPFRRGHHYPETAKTPTGSGRGRCIESRRLCRPTAAGRNAVGRAGGEWRRHADETQSRPHSVNPRRGRTQRPADPSVGRRRHRRCAGACRRDGVLRQLRR